MTAAAAPFADLDVSEHLLYALQLSLGVVFLLSAAPKLRHPAVFAKTVAEYQILSPKASRAAAPGLISVECFLVVAFLTGWLLDLALPLAAASLLAFLAATSINLRRGREIPCGCFGNPTERVSRRSLSRLWILLVVVLILAGAFTFAGVSPITLDWLVARGPSSLLYLLQVAALSASLILLALWCLTLPELTSILRRASRTRPKPANPLGRPGTGQELT